MKRITIIVAVLATTFLRVQPALATTHVPVGRWKMDENPIGPRDIIRDEIGRHDGVTPNNWNGFSVAPLTSSGSGAAFFPGWTDADASGAVTPTASSFSIAHRSAFDPQREDFSVSIWLHALDPSSSIEDGTLSSRDTFNIVQKGLAPGQQWKLSVDAKGRFICTFRGPDASGTIDNFKAVSEPYPFGVTRRLRCSLRDRVITTKVTTGDASDVYTAPGPAHVANADDIWVGKKPNSTDPGDAFAGTLDDLILRKGG